MAIHRKLGRPDQETFQSLCDELHNLADSLEGDTPADNQAIQELRGTCTKLDEIRRRILNQIPPPRPR